MARVSRAARDERGFALALAMFALAVMGALVALNFFSALLEQQGGRNVLISTQAAEAAEGALLELIPQLEAASLLPLTVGSSGLDLDPVSPRAGLVIQRRVARLADNLFLVESRAVWASGAGGNRVARSVALLAQLSADSASGAQILLPIKHRAWLQLY